jgi:transcriptional regulator with XRE-family HTH domain
MEVCCPVDDTFGGVCDNATVEDRNYLKQWRQKAGLTLEQLADKVGTNKSVIFLLENEQRPLSAKWLRKLADALGTTPGRILDVNPEEANADVLDIWDHIRAKDRATAIRVLRSLTGTND